MHISFLPSRVCSNAFGATKLTIPFAIPFVGVDLLMTIADTNCMGFLRGFSVEVDLIKSLFQILISLSIDHYPITNNGVLHTKRFYFRPFDRI